LIHISRAFAADMKGTSCNQRWDRSLDFSLKETLPTLPYFVCVCMNIIHLFPCRTFSVCTLSLIQFKGSRSVDSLVIGALMASISEYRVGPLLAPLVNLHRFLYL